MRVSQPEELLAERLTNIHYEKKFVSTFVAKHFENKCIIITDKCKKVLLF